MNTRGLRDWFIQEFIRSNKNQCALKYFVRWRIKRNSFQYLNQRMLIIWYFVTLLSIMFTLPSFTAILKTNCKDTLGIGNMLWVLFEHQILQTILGLHCFFICSEHIIAFLLPCLDIKFKHSTYRNHLSCNNFSCILAS